MGLLPNPQPQGPPFRFGGAWGVGGGGMMQPVKPNRGDAPVVHVGSASPPCVHGDGAFERAGSVSPLCM